MRKALALVLVLAVALGCGAGGSLAGGGIGGSGLSSGAISGFGSIFVTGTEYETNGASVTLERVASSASALRVGMVVVVEGDRTGATGTAKTVRYDDEIEGPITAIAAPSIDEKVLTILGQSVAIERTLTQFDASSGAAPSFDTIAVGDLVEVSGFRRAADIQATYVKKKGVAAPNASVELKGTVSGAAGQSFTLGTILVNWNGSTTLSDLPSGGPTNGDFVEVEGTLTNATTVQATRIERESDAFTGNRDEFEIEGSVTQFASLASFRVDGQLVNASGANVQFEPNDPALVRNGVRVEVEGRLSNGTVVAEKVKLREGEVRIHAEIAAAGDIDGAARTVRLLGVTIRADASTQLEDDLLGVPDFDVSDMTAGDFLEVRGVEDGSGGVLATEIERADGPDDVRVRGSVTAIDTDPAGGRAVAILGVVVPTDASTQFEGFSAVNDEDDFYAAVQLGNLLDARDDEDGDETAIDVADEIELENP